MSVKSEEILLDILVRAYTMGAVQVDSELEWITDDDELDQGVCWRDNLDDEKVFVSLQPPPEWIFGHFLPILDFLFRFVNFLDNWTFLSPFFAQ